MRVYDLRTKSTAFYIFFKTPRRSVMKRFTENYRVLNNRNIVDSHISAEKFIINVSDSKFTGELVPYRSGRVENINSGNIIGIQHKQILNYVQKMYDNMDAHTSVGFTLSRVFFLTNTSPQVG
jgi:predicted transcriptional regulator of viral defense system